MLKKLIAKIDQLLATFDPSINLEHMLLSGVGGYALAQTFHLDTYNSLLVATFMALGGSANDLMSFLRNTKNTPALLSLIATKVKSILGKKSEGENKDDS